MRSLLLALLLSFASPGVALAADEKAQKEGSPSVDESLAWLRTRLQVAMADANRAKAHLAVMEKRAEASSPAGPARVPAPPAAHPENANAPIPAPAGEEALQPPAPEVPSAAQLKAAAAWVVNEEREVGNLETTIAVLRGARVRVEDAKQALGAIPEWRVEVQRELSVEPKAAAGEKPFPPTDAQTAQRALSYLKNAENVLTEMVDTEEGVSTASIETKATRSQLEFKRGDRLHYGPTVSLLRFNTSRAPDEPGSERNYEPRLELVPAEFGFQFVYEPWSDPWRLMRADGKPFQLISAGGILLARLDKDKAERGALGLAATLSFFNQVLGLGLGVDLYRGIPTLGANGQLGGDTAYTGLLAWSFARDGELTAENVFFVVTLGLQPIISGLTGQAQ